MPSRRVGPFLFLHHKFSLRGFKSADRESVDAEEEPKGGQTKKTCFPCEISYASIDQLNTASVTDQSSESMVPAKPTAPATKRSRPLLRLFAALILGLCALSVPQVFRGAVWCLLQEEVLRQGGRLKVTVQKGALWEPVVLSGIRLSLPLAAGGQFRLQAERCNVVGTLRPLLSGAWNLRFLDRIQILGGVVDWDIGTGPAKGVARNMDLWLLEGFRLGQVLQLPPPVALDLELKGIQIRSGNWSLRSEHFTASVSEVAPGMLKAANLEVKVGNWTRAFRDVSGKTAMQGDTLKIGEMTLMEGLRLESLTASASKAEGGSGGLFDLEIELQTFGGELRVLAQVGPPSSEVPLEASGTFAKLGVAQLAAFLNFTEAAGGTLVAGKFSFRGQPAAPERATASVRMEARNFQWESRQWDELVVGATLLDRRIQVPEFSLRQGQNQLLLNGDMQWPGAEAPWWKADFGVNLTARVENLTELSALLLPEFKYAAGGLTIDGAVRSQGGVLGGALIVSGANLTWRNVPVEELHAAVKLQGSEVQVLNVEVAQGTDWVRGKGTIQVGHAWSYQGELHGNVRDLGKYAALLQPPVGPEPYAGGVELEWSGKGGSEGNEGRVRARFLQLRPLRPQPGWQNALSGDLSGTYNAAGLELESLVLGDGQIQLRTGFKASKEGFQFLRLNIQQGERTALEGDAFLPKEWVDQWAGLSFAALLKCTTPMTCNVAASGLDLSLLGHLPGTPRGLEGIVDGQWQMKGTLAELSGAGGLTLRRGGVGVAGGIFRSVEADLAWNARTLKASRLAWLSASGKYEGTAALEWKPGAPVPTLEAAVSCPEAVWQGPQELRFALAPNPQKETPRSAPVSVLGQISWKVSGLLSDPLLSAEAVVRAVDFVGTPDLRLLFTDSNLGQLDWGRSQNPMLKDWKLQLRVTSTDGASVLGTPGAARFDLHAGGTPAQPLWHGEVRLALRAAAADVPLEVEPLVLKFLSEREGPELEVRARGQSGTTTFSASALGPLGHPVRKYEAEPALHAEKVRSVFEDSKAW